MTTIEREENEKVYDDEVLGALSAVIETVCARTYRENTEDFGDAEAAQIEADRRRDEQVAREAEGIIADVDRDADNYLWELAAVPALDRIERRVVGNRLPRYRLPRISRRAARRLLDVIRRRGRGDDSNAAVLLKRLAHLAR